MPRTIDAEHFLLAVRLKRERIDDPDAYPFRLPALRALDDWVLHPKVTFVVGENGSGKSTLLEAVAVAWGFNAEGGSRDMRFATRDSHSPLHEALTLMRGIRRPRDGYFLRAESFYNVASAVDDYGVARSYGGVSLHAQSHGESFLSLLEHRFRGQGFYILDEPEAALSPQNQLAMLVRLHDLVGQGSQFLIATHSPLVMAFPEADIWQIDDAGLRKVAYRDTAHVQLTRAFLEHPERYLRHLFD